MVLIINYEDEFTLNEFIKWEFKDSASGVTKEYITELIKERFNKAANYLGVNKNPDFSDACIKINIIMRSPSNNASLAYFDLYNLHEASKEFNFKLYADVLLKIIHSGTLSLIDTIWVHEIVHMIDYKEILKAKNIIKKRILQVNSEGHSAFSVKKDKHLFLLNIITHFRDEGISTLMEYIAGDIDKKLSSPDEALSEFHNIIKSAISYIYQYNSGGNKIYNYLKEIKR